MKKIKIEFTNERIIPASGLAVVGSILGKSDFVKRCNRMDVTPNRSQNQIKNGDVLLTYIGLLTIGKPAYESVRRMGMDDIGSSMRSYIPAENIKMLRDNALYRENFQTVMCLWILMSRSLIIPKPMLMVNKEAPQNKTRTASPAAIPYSREQIAEQAAAAKSKMNGAYAPPYDSRRPSCFCAKQGSDRLKCCRSRLL